MRRIGKVKEFLVSLLGRAIGTIFGKIFLSAFVQMVVLLKNPPKMTKDNEKKQVIHYEYFQ